MRVGTQRRAATLRRRSAGCGAPARLAGQRPRAEGAPVAGAEPRQRKKGAGRRHVSRDQCRDDRQAAGASSRRSPGRGREGADHANARGDRWPDRRRGPPARHFPGDAVDEDEAPRLAARRRADARGIAKPPRRAARPVMKEAARAPARLLPDRSRLRSGGPLPDEAARRRWLYPWNSLRMSWLFWLAIDSDWMPSCCCVCNACKRVEASFISASTKPLTPFV